MPRHLRSDGDGLWAAVGYSAGAKILVMGISGVLGIITSRLIIQHFGVGAYAQYGLLSSITALLPFADLGIAAVIINAVAGSDDVKSDGHVRAVITTALRILIVSGSIIAAVGFALFVLGWWPAVLGDGLLAGGSLAAFLCLAVFGLVLPLSVGPRVLVGLGRVSTQVSIQAVVAPTILVCVVTSVALSIPAGNYLAVFSYAASGVSAFIGLLVAARHVRPQIAMAIKAVPHRRRYPGVAVGSVAWPMLLQMLALPVAIQTDRLLLSHLTDGPQLAQYNLASQIFGLVLQTIAAAGITLWPIYAKARSSRRIESPAVPTMWFTLGGLLLGVTLAAISPWLVPYISAGKITLDPALMIGFVVFVTLQAAKYPAGMYMTDKRGLTFQVIPILIMVPLNLGISWWLVGVVGAAGPILGSAIGVLACQVIPNLWYVRRDLAKRRAVLESDTESTDIEGTTDSAGSIEQMLLDEVDDGLT
jgi:O-antigen/teichoic acid export membrane protein